MKSASLRKVTEILIKITIVAINVTVHQGGVSSNEKRCGTVGFWECETVEDHHKHHFRAFQSQPWLGFEGELLILKTEKVGVDFAKKNAKNVWNPCISRFSLTKPFICENSLFFFNLGEKKMRKIFFQTIFFGVVPSHGLAEFKIWRQTSESNHPYELFNSRQSQLQNVTFTLILVSTPLESITFECFFIAFLKTTKTLWGNGRDIQRHRWSWRHGTLLHWLIFFDWI